MPEQTAVVESAPAAGQALVVGQALVEHALVEESLVEEPLVEESLVEEVSIDGMCGVY